MTTFTTATTTNLGKPLELTIEDPHMTPDDARVRLLSGLPVFRVSDATDDTLFADRSEAVRFLRFASEFRPGLEMVECHLGNIVPRRVSWADQVASVPESKRSFVGRLFGRK